MNALPCCTAVDDSHGVIEMLHHITVIVNVIIVCIRDLCVVICPVHPPLQNRELHDDAEAASEGSICSP